MSVGSNLFMEVVAPEFRPIVPHRSRIARPKEREWLSLCREVFRADGWKCVYCDIEGVPLTCDHIVPLARGGDNAVENLATACRTCNLSKGAKLVSEWLR